MPKTSAEVASPPISVEPLGQGQLDPSSAVILDAVSTLTVDDTGAAITLVETNNVVSPTTEERHAVENQSAAGNTLTSLSTPEKPTDALRMSEAILSDDISPDIPTSLSAPEKSSGAPKMPPAILSDGVATTSMPVPEETADVTKVSPAFLSDDVAVDTPTSLQAPEKTIDAPKMSLATSSNGIAVDVPTSSSVPEKSSDAPPVFSSDDMEVNIPTPEKTTDSPKMSPAILSAADTSTSLAPEKTTNPQKMSLVVFSDDGSSRDVPTSLSMPVTSSRGFTAGKVASAAAHKSNMSHPALEDGLMPVTPNITPILPSSSTVPLGVFTSHSTPKTL